jgi:hypothetical protein
MPCSARARPITYRLRSPLPLDKQDRSAPLDDEPVEPEDAGAEAAWAKYEQGYAHPRSDIENVYRAQDAREAETGGVAL